MKRHQSSNEKERHVKREAVRLQLIGLRISFQLDLFLRVPRESNNYILFQVPMVRNEANAYGGEMSGIKSKVSKSVKIK